MSENPVYNPAAAHYAAGRADQLAGYVDVELAVASEAYRHGQQDERTAAVDAELLRLGELRGTTTTPNQPPDKEISAMADNILPNGLDGDVLAEWEATATEAARQYAAEHPGADLKEVVVAGAKAGLDRVTRRPLSASAAEDEQ